MGAIERFRPASPETRGGAVERPVANLGTRLRGLRLWNGQFSDSSDEIVEPTWESLPEAVRWQATGRNTLVEPAVGSFVVSPSICQKGDAHVEATSGWQLHPSGVFVVDAERPLQPIGGVQYRPSGEWTSSFHQCSKEAFRMKHGQFGAEVDTDELDDDGVPTDLRPMWLSMPIRSRRLLDGMDGAPDDSADWWVVGDRGRLRMTICYQRRSERELRAVLQTRSVTLQPGENDPIVRAQRLVDAPRDVCVFAARLDLGKVAFDARHGAASLDEGRPRVVDR